MNKKPALIKITEYIAELFRQGLTPTKIALSIAVGISAGSFPILGFATPMCALFAIIFKLNMGVVQLVNYAAAPIHLTLIPIFLWLSSLLPWNKPLSFDLHTLKSMLPHTWSELIASLSSYLVGAILIWLIFMPIASAILYSIIFFLMRYSQIMKKEK